MKNPVGVIPVLLVMLLAAGCAEEEPMPLGFSAPAPPDEIPIGAAVPVPGLEIPTPPPDAGGPVPDLSLEPVASGLDQPVVLTAPAGDDRRFVAEKAGTIRIIGPDGKVAAQPFLDLSPVVSAADLERGLLGLAFHPDFARNGRLFVHYTGPEGASTVVEFRVDRPDSPIVRVTRGRPILVIDQPAPTHNGGMLQFGPDGYLYMGLGDGGFGDPRDNAADPTNPLGSLLRLDVDSARPYAVGPDSPFLEDGSPEIWMYGFRNLWRFWIDPVDRLIHLGDVGNFSWEEVTVLPLGSGGANLGWPVMEADTCLDAETCDQTGLVLPHIVYTHTPREGRRFGCAVITGPVYRGTTIPGMWGRALYADYCEGWVRSYLFAEGAVRGDIEHPGLRVTGGIVSFGTNGRGEPYLLAADGSVYRIVAG